MGQILLRHWKSSSESSVSQSNDHKSNVRRKPSGWCKLAISALVPCILGIFTIVFTLQQQELSKQQQEQERWHQLDSQQQTSFGTYINDVSNYLAQQLNVHTGFDKTSLLYIRTKTLTVLRILNAERRKYVLLFLYESGLIRDFHLDLRGADLSNVQLIGPYKLDNLYLPGVFWSNAMFVDCQLTNATFDRSIMNNTHFIRSKLDSASFVEAILNYTNFRGSDIMQANFTGAHMVGANFLDAEVVQGNIFINSDLLGARFTKEQFQGQRLTTVPHKLDHARLPNGTFGPIDAKKNLVRNGDAEWNCSTEKPGASKMIYSNTILYTRDVRNISIMNMTFGDFERAKCSFAVEPKARAIQNIDLRLYSLLIDAGLAVFTASALIGCDIPGNNAYLSVLMQRPDGLAQGQRLYLSSDGIKLDDKFVMQPYRILAKRMMKYTRQVAITFGVETLRPPGSWCYFDNMTFSVRQTI
ncbi:hypothetical protein I4U23_022817 [Adineta vaga]|nr:hypothetical protein I4U23_022817 [Adineta vaga]